MIKPAHRQSGIGSMREIGKMAKNSPTNATTTDTVAESNPKAGKDLCKASSAPMDMVTANFDRTWKRKLTVSRHKSREWLMRHAMEIYEFRVTCAENDIDYGQRLTDWLGYSAALGSQWVKTGEFIANYRENVDSLPASMSTICEISRMTPEQLAIAEKEKLITPSVTRQHISEFRKRLTHQTEKNTKAYDVAKHIEDELYAWHYSDNIPEEVIEFVEDMAADELGESLSLPGWELTLADDGLTWIGREVKQKTKGHDSKASSTVKKNSGNNNSTDLIDSESGPIDGDGILVSRTFTANLAPLGVDLHIETLAPWALAALLKAAKIANHPDKGTGDGISIESVLESERYFS